MSGSWSSSTNLITVVDKDGTHHQLDLPVENATIISTSDGTYIETRFGTYWLSFDGEPHWTFHKAPWVTRIERQNDLRHDVLAFLDAAGNGGHVLAERVRKEHW